MKIQLTEHKKVFNFCEPYIIAEIGANHNGDMKLAKEMIDSASACGVDAVKFQSWTPKSLISKEEYERNRHYDDDPKKHWGSLKEMIEKYHLTRKQHEELLDYCRGKGVDFCSSAFSDEEASMLHDLNVPFFKVASMDINNLSFLSYMAGFNKPMVVSTGMASLKEIERAVDVIEKEGNSKIVLLHCISVYPPDYEDIHLRNIPMLEQSFGYPVGFSDHTCGYAIPLASIGLGACLIEKHFTTSKDLPGWDHDISTDSDEMTVICRESKNIVKALGSSRRTVSQAEIEKRLKFRRSMVAVGPLPKGHAIESKDVVFKRPGTGIPPDLLEQIIGRRLNKNIEEDDLIHWEDFE
jgi:sialic acid synthase SpsE